MKLSSLINTPEEFLAAIPTDPAENIDFRIKLHTALTKDKAAQIIFLQMLLAKPQIAFNTCYFTLNPRNKPGFRNAPFILRPQQSVVVEDLHYAIQEGEDRALDKSREEGATEIICKLYTLHWLLIPESMFVIGSSKDELVYK